MAFKHLPCCDDYLLFLLFQISNIGQTKATLIIKKNAITWTTKQTKQYENHWNE